MDFAGHVERVMALDNDAITRELRHLELEERALHVRRSALLAVAEAKNVPADDGHASTMGWLIAHTNCPRIDAIRARQLATMLDHLHDVAAEFSAGTIGTAQARRFATALAQTSSGPLLLQIDRTALITAAQHQRYEDFATTITRWETLADINTKQHHDAVNIERRDGHVTATETGLTIRFNGGDPLVAAEAAAIYQTYVDEQFEIDTTTRDAADGSGSLPRTAAQRRFDAIIQILRDAQATTGRRSPAAGVIVNIVVSQDVFENTLAYHHLFNPTQALPARAAGLQHCETSTGIVLDPDVVITRALTDHIRHIIIGNDHRVVNLGRTQRLFNPAAKQAAALLPTSCSWPGCCTPAELCDTDHITEWATDNGPTDLTNATPTCSRHNRWRSQHRYRTTPTRHGTLIQHRPDNTYMHPVGQPRPTPPPKRLEFPIITLHHHDHHDLLERQRPRRQIAGTPSVRPAVRPDRCDVDGSNRSLQEAAPSSGATGESPGNDSGDK
jgi:hypothetical protein